MITQLLNLFIAGLIVVVVVFTITWLVQLKTKNATIADGVWAASFSLLTIIYFITTDGYFPRKILITGMTVTWSLRLTGYLFIRAMGHPEDVRYTTLRIEWGNKHNLFMLRFFYFQAVLALILTVPFALIMMNKTEAIRPIEWIGVVVWAVAFIGESIADSQMNTFRKNSTNKGKVCNIGLWKYSRHPNYFFEWLIWVAFFITALASPFGIFTIVCPTAILYFLLKVTGIPYTEAQLIKSRGKAYEEYQLTTSSFIPLPRKTKK